MRIICVMKCSLDEECCLLSVLLIADLLGRIRHLGAEKAKRLETLADGMNVGHAHEHHLTVRVVLYRREQQTSVSAAS